MRPSIERIAVLHVDDDAAFADVTAAFLQREDDRIEVTTRLGPDAGLERLADADAPAIDCVVSDYDMPETNGIEFLEHVRDRHGDLPFVLFTGKGSEEVASDAISAGVTDYLQKSTGSEQYALLANRVRNAVRSYRSQHALADRNRRLETLIGNLPGIVYRCRNAPGWPMEFVGGECERLSGYTAEELETAELVWGDDVVHPEDREPVWRDVQDALAADEPFEVTYRIVTRDGRTRWMWERGQATETVVDDDVILEGFITDVTEQKKHVRTLEGLHDTFRDVMGADSPHGVAEVVVASVRDLLDVPFIGCWLYDPAADALVPVAARDASGELGDLPTYRDGTGLSWTAFETGEVQVFDDVTMHPERANPDTLVRSEIILPLGDHGVLNIGSDEVAAFTDTDVSIARVLAANTEAALERASSDAS